MRVFSFAAACSAALLMVGTASAAPIGNGQTSVQPTADLDALGLDLVLVGGSVGSADPLRVLFDITGGDLDFASLAGQIEHDGASLNLVADLGDTDPANDIIVNLSNFVIDTVNSELVGDVDLGGDGSVDATAALFTFDLTGLTAEQITALDNPVISLIFSDVAADLLEDVFALDDTVQLNDVEFGLAATAPTPAEVSEPGMAALFGASLLGLGLVRRRSR